MKPETNDPSVATGDVPPSFGLDEAADGWMDRLREAETPSRLGCIGPYELIAEVSRGGQGIVYQARQPGTNRSIAVKRLLAGSLATSTMRKRFEREIELAASLNHPNIVTVHGIEVIDGQPLLAMEWIDGVPIDVWADRGGTERRSPHEIADMLCVVCDAVRHAHQRGVIHRDLKPSNILVDKDDVPHVLDFGLARSIAAGAADGQCITLTEQFVGTPAFSSPEHLRGGLEAMDVRADVYSLGVILYNSLTGRFPYDVSGDLPEVFRNIEQADPIRPSSVSPRVDREIESITLKALRKDKQERYQTVDALGDDLRRYLQGESIVAHPPSALYQLRKIVRRHRLPVALASIVFVLVGAFAITATYQAMRIRTERDESRREAAKAEAVSEFLRDMFASPDPERRGHEVRVVDVLGASQDKIDSGFRDQPEVRVVLHSTLGETYFGLGLYEEADERYQAALRTGTESLGERDELTLDAMSSLGVIRSVRNELGDAEELLRGAYRGFVETLGEEAPPTLIAANNLAGLLRRIDRLDEAEDLYRKTYEIRVRTLGEDDLDTLASMNNLSMMLLFRGKPEEAEPLQLKTLRGCRRMFGESHPKTLLTLNNYARLLHRLGRLTESASYVRELVAVRRESLPADHPDTMLTIDNLAMVLKDAGQFDEAARLLQELVEAYLSEDPPEHPAHWNARGKDLFPHHLVFELAAIHVSQSDGDAVVRLFDRTLARKSDFVGEDRWRLGRVRHEYGKDLVGLSRHADAEKQLLAALEHLRETRGMDDPSTRAVVASLASLYHEMGKENLAGVYDAALGISPGAKPSDR